MTGPNLPWEPDPNKLGNWQAMFETRRNGGTAQPPAQPAAPPAASLAQAFDDADMPRIDAAEYKPWILQRGRNAMMLALRWFDAKAGYWHGCAIAYPSLYTMDTIGDRMVSLDFGARKFVIEGSGLDLLARYLLQGNVLKIVEYTPAVWPNRAEGPVVMAIRRLPES